MAAKNANETSTAPGVTSKIPFFEYIRYTEIKRLIQQVRSELDKNDRKSISVISEYPGEGKTFFTAVLAVGFAHLLHRRVLIVDTTTQTQGGNLFLDRIFESNPSKLGTTHRSDSNNTQSDAQFVDLISPKNPGGGGSDESSDFDIGPLVDRHKDMYDLILFDTCALSLANKNNMDPVIISKHAGAAILIQTQKSVDVDVIRNVREQLDNWNIALVGTVFNAGLGRAR